MAALTYPGVYIQEVPSGVRTITGVATSITAFIGRARRGAMDRPVRVQSFAEYSRVFGGLWQHSTMSYAVSHFFQHGGANALIVRVHNGAAPATGSADGLNLVAASPGQWGTLLRVRVDHDTRPEVGNEKLFNLTVRDTSTGSTELFRNVSVETSHARYIGRILEEESGLVRLDGPAPADRPGATQDAEAGVDPMTVTPGSIAFGADGDDGNEIEDQQVIPIEENAIQAREGIYALESADLFNLLCIPPLSRDNDVGLDTWGKAAKYCQDRRAMLIVDPPAAWTANATDAIRDAEEGVKSLRKDAIGNDLARNAMVYYPRLRMPDPLGENRLADFAPCGAVAGIIARTDAQRGVWKAPAGMEASFSGVQGFTYTLTDGQNGILNPLALNCLRSFPVAGNLVWGARTLAGADLLVSEWKYLPVRRLALFLEESLYRGTQWVVFEPNDEPLWSQIRLNVGAFMHNLFRQGAFQGRSPREAYFVKCDRETTTQNDINLGIVNILVGFAPLKPAEFVVIKIQQMAGQVES